MGDSIRFFCFSGDKAIALLRDQPVVWELVGSWGDLFVSEVTRLRLGEDEYQIRLPLTANFVLTSPTRVEVRGVLSSIYEVRIEQDGRESFPISVQAAACVSTPVAPPSAMFQSPAPSGATQSVHRGGTLAFSLHEVRPSMRP